MGIIMALLFKGTMFKGEPVPFVMELPNYRLPGMKNVGQLLWEKAKTTLSFAINPVTRAVDIRQSPNPSGAKTGERAPAIIAKILSFESVTIFRLVSKLCKNQITIVAAKITARR